jgi:hypothetical protein
MIVYALNKKKATHTMYLCPGADPELKGEKPSEWFNDKNEAINFTVEFKAGRAEVSPDSVGKYLLERGLAKKTKLILPEAA